MKSWFDHVIFHTRTQPETPAMVMEDRVVTYGMLSIGIERCARRIVDLGIGDGLVAVMITNQIRHLTLCLSLFRIGIRSISITKNQPGIEQLKLAAVLCDGEARGLFGSGNRVIEITDEWFGMDGPAATVLPQSFSDRTQLCRVSLTSGATGMPKIINHTAADVGRRISKLTEFRWTFALSLPGLTSNWGFTTACAVLATGQALCFIQSPFQAVRMIELYSIDFVMTSTEQLLALARVARKSGAHLRSLRTVWVAGGVATRALLEAAMIYVCKNTLCGYAASETGMMAQATATEVLSNPGLAGHVVPGVEAGIFDAKGERRPVGQVGFIRIRPDDDVDRPLSGERPWIDVGDIGWIAPDGRLFVLGRAVDVNLVGLQNAAAHQLSPVHEVEHLLRLEWDATDAAAVLVEDIARGSQAQIWVGVVDCKDANAENLAAIARPRGIEHPIRLFDLPAIPRGASGKVNREQLKALLLASATGRA